MSIATQAEITAQNPWPGLGAFDEGAEQFFNGRDEEAAELRRLVLNAPLATLFGLSGLGKTSLLQAGLFPLLRREHVLPVYVRLDYETTHEPLSEQIKRALQREMVAHHVDAPSFADGETLWEYLHRAGLELWSGQNHLLTPLLVLDQFEEAFTLGADRAAEVARLRHDLSELAENRVPDALAETLRRDSHAASRYDLGAQRYKVLLSFREDFLPAVEGWKHELPSIMRNRLRLRPMTATRAFEAVHRTAPHLVDPALARRIVDFVAAAQDRMDVGVGEAGERLVEPALLSLVCHGLNRQRVKRGMATLDQRLLDETGASIISDFYDQSVADLRPEVRRFVETELITEKGFRKQCDVDDARVHYGLSDDELTTLVDRRLLRIEPERGSDRVELTHDLLTGVVRAARERERDRARAALRARRWRRRAMGVGAALGAILVLLVIREQRKHDRLQEDRIRLLAEVAAQNAHLVVLDTILAAQAKARESEVNLDVSNARLRSLERARDTASATQRASLDSSILDMRKIVAVRQDTVRVAHETQLRAAAKAAAYFSGGRILPFDSYSRLDLFDVSKEGVVGEPVDGERAPGRSILKLFGDSLEDRWEPELQPHFLPDSEPPFHHVVSWRMRTPIAVGSVALFIQHDGVNGQIPTVPWRALTDLEFQLQLLGAGDADSAWVTVAALNPALPYAGEERHRDAQPFRSLAICLPVRVMAGDDRTRLRRIGAEARRSRQFRLSARPATMVGPRIVELDAYADTTCQAPSAAQLAKIDSAGVMATFERDYLSSTTAIALVLEQLERAVRELNTARAVNATEFLAQTRNAAWNQAQVCWAGDVVRLARDAAGGQEPVAELHALLPRLKPKLDSIVSDWTQASRCPPERPRDPVSATVR